MFILSFSAFGQTPPITSSTPPAQTKESDDEPIKVNTLLLNIPVIASDREGRNVSGLTKKDFIITQNGEKQTVEFFSDEYAPMNVAIIVDTSGSVTSILGNIKKAARTFLKVLRPEDTAMVVSFDGRVKILSELTSNQKDLEKAIDRLGMIEPEGSYMYDAIDEVINNKFAAVKGRKAIILLTDGFVGGLRITNQEFMRTLSESDTVVYPILFLFRPVQKNSPPTTSINYVKEWASATAGKLYYGGADLQTAFQSIAEEMKKQYSIGFYPQNAEMGKPPDIKININRENVVLRTKRTIRLKTPSSKDK
jgi:Ca-activated chloride channel family protein